MRTLVICLFSLTALGATSTGATRHVTVVHELVVVPEVHPAHMNARKTASRREAPHVRRHGSHAAAERPSWLARVGQAIGITVHHR